MKQQTKILTAGEPIGLAATFNDKEGNENDSSIEAQLKKLLAQDYYIDSMVVIQSGGYSVYTSHAEKVLVLFHEREWSDSIGWH